MDEEFAKEEYERQFYDFSLADFKEQSKIMVKEVVRANIKAVIKNIHSKLGSKEACPAENTVIDQICTDISSKIYANMDGYESLVEKYFTIPDYVILPENEEHDVNVQQEVTEADLIDLKIQSQVLEAEVFEMAKSIKTLEQELIEYENCKESYEEMSELIKTLESTISTDSNHLVNDNNLLLLEKMILENQGQ